MKYLKTFLLGIAAGAAIGLGGFIFVLLASIGQKFLGSVCFSVGLFLVCSLSLMLYTGKIGPVIDNVKREYFINLFIMFVGNVLGAVGFGYLMYVTKITSLEHINTFLTNLVATRNTESIGTMLKGGSFCGAFVFLAVYFFKKKNWFYPLRVLGLVICVTFFVYFGFEHCVANCFYYSIANAWNWTLVANIILVMLGNSLGAILTAFAMRIIDRK